MARSPITVPDISVQLQLGIQHLQAGRLAEAEGCFQGILQREPEHAEAWHFWGVMAAQGKQFAVARERIERSISINPAIAAFHSNLGNVLKELGCFTEAIATCRKALALAPDFADAYHNLGIALQAEGKLDEAIAASRQALVYRPDHPDVHFQLGRALKKQGHFLEAIDHYQAAIQGNPQFAEAHNNLGNIFREQGRFVDAENSLRSALRHRPNFVDAHNNLAAVLQNQGRFFEAITSARTALNHKPDHVGAHWNLSLLLLLMGEYQSGWEEYEWRFKRVKCIPKSLLTPPWQDEFPINKKVLIWSEQGLGDSIQFIRYAVLLKQQGIDVTLVTKDPLRRLFQDCLLVGKMPVIEQDRSDLSEYEVHTSLMSLPRLFQTRVETIPTGIPYLRPPAMIPAALQLNKDKSFKVGIVWASGVENVSLYKQKSLPAAMLLQALGELLQSRRISLWSLQVGQDAGQIEPWLEWPGVYDLSPLLQDFVDTAWAIEQLDLVITVDTAVAHLAGAMGKQVWVLLPFVPDWRWLLDRQDSPWYPTMRLFRQPSLGNWEAVMDNVTRKLQDVLNGESAIFPVEIECVSSQPVKDITPSSTEKINQQINLGIQHFQSGNLLLAKKYFEQAIIYDPTSLLAHSNLGVVLQQQGRTQEAITSYQNAIRLDPGHADSHYNLGCVLQQVGDLEQAVVAYQKAIELNPSHSSSHNNFGNTLRDLNKIDEAIAAYYRAIKYDSNHAGAHTGLGLSMLLIGNYEIGWQEYGWRFLGRSPVKKPVSSPSWQGKLPPQQKVLIWSEQGLGDSIQFIRYVLLLQQQGIEVTIATKKPLVRLFQSFLLSSSVVVLDQDQDQESLRNYEVHTSTMSLPQVFQTTVDTVPTTNPYIQVSGAIPKQLQLPATASLKVGVVWASDPNNAQLYARKSLPPALIFSALADLVESDKFSLWSLQVGQDASQIEPWLSLPGVNDLSPLLQDFVDTAWAIEQLDLVITVDTAVAHLAGAMGKPVWVLLPFVPDWRWLLDRQDSPWYPTMRLFRQPSLGDWAAVMVDVKQKLQDVLAGKSAIFPVETLPASASTPPDVGNDYAATSAMPKILVMNLQRRLDRRHRFQQWNSQAVLGYEFSSAVDGQSLKLPDLVKENLATPHLQHYTLGALGCALSHRALWQQCITENQPILLCEDDAVLRQDFTTIVPHILQQLSPDWEIVFLGYNLDSALSVEISPGVIMHSHFPQPDLTEQGLLTFQMTTVMPTILPLKSAFGTCAYVVSPKGAQVLLDRCFPLTNRSYFVPSLNRTIMSFGIDSVMNEFHRDARAFCVIPPVAVSPNDKTDSDISFKQ